MSSSTTVRTIALTPTWSALAGVFEVIAESGTDEGFASVVQELAKVTDRAAKIATAFRPGSDVPLDKARDDLREVLVAADKRNDAARAARN